MGNDVLNLWRFLKPGLWAVPVYLVFVTFLTLLIQRPLDNISQDLLISIASPFLKPADDIVIVTISEETLRKFPYRSPIDRSFVSDLISKISEGKPTAIGLDILFDQPTEAEKDQRLASILKSSKVPVIVASASIEDGLSAEQVNYLNEFVPEAMSASVRLLRDPTDSVVRELFIGQKLEGDLNLGFSAAIASAAGTNLPTNQTQHLVYYLAEASKPFNFTTYPAHSVPIIPADWFSGKLVLIGMDLLLEDRHPTPFVTLKGARDGSMPGVVIHAHGLSQILNGDQILRLGYAPSVAIIFVIVLLNSWLIWKPSHTLFKPLVALLGLFSLWLAAFLLLSEFKILMPVAAPSIAILSITSLVAFAAWKRDREGKRFIEQAFSHYVNPAVVKTIVDQPGTLKLGGERRFITCICTDLTDFTRYSEQLDPEEIASTLNQYLGRVCELFTEHQATIDKIVGDAVVGFFGAPISQTQQADRAIALALAIDEFSERFRDEMASQDRKFGATRIGVHAGPAIVGNFGGARFFDYTAVGDTVNTVARLERANKKLGTRICISSVVAEGATNAGNLRPSGTIELPGKTDVFQVFEALQPQDAGSDLMALYIEAYSAMKNGDAKAKEMFAKLVRLAPEDNLIRFHFGRLQERASDDNV